MKFISQIKDFIKVLKPKLKLFMFGLWIIVFTYRLSYPIPKTEHYKHTYNYYFSCDSTEVIATIIKLSKE